VLNESLGPKNIRKTNVSKMFVKEIKNKELRSIITFEVLSNGSRGLKNRRKTNISKRSLKKNKKKELRNVITFEVLPSSSKWKSGT
jgi:hypothetical protein